MRKKVFVFDLDFTLWDAGGTWCDATNPPYSWEDGRVMDTAGHWIRLYPDVTAILELLRTENRKIVAASRTYEPNWAKDLLRLFAIDHFFDLKEIYPADKTRHFQHIKNHFHIPFSEMVFYDDEYRNIEAVKQLGVQCIYVDNGIQLSSVAAFL